MRFRDVHAGTEYLCRAPDRGWYIGRVTGFDDVPTRDTRTEYDPDDLDDDGEPIVVVYDGDEHWPEPQQVEYGAPYRHVHVTVRNVDELELQSVYGVENCARYAGNITLKVHPRTILYEWGPHIAGIRARRARAANDAREARLRELADTANAWAAEFGSCPRLHEGDSPGLIITADTAREVLARLRV